ncbi:disease resistance protein RPV1-like [Diospyros lotus]|uniref:disease resistance protein RPV1-like n=1 Tax=Diospyros lotus TaxID=55363 RepID=UPI00224F7C6A|nr:disease resistance protein RPV1-like [Diospyros lotus]
MAASSSSPILPLQRKYDVFLSFRGLDSRKNIISHLQAALKRNGFRTFKDDKNLDRGKDIEAGLFEAIENSSMSIVVFSKNYFASKWCLAELEKIMEYSKNLHHIVIPIFVDIEPSDIRKLKGSIAETLAKHEEEVPKMENWRATLTEVASLAGFVSNSDKDEASLVEDIVEEVQGKLSLRIPLKVTKHPVGIEPRLQKVLKELCLESSDDVRIVAIWGVGGLGKTTIAKAAYNCIRSGFEGCSFVANVRETWEQSKGNLLALQKQILSDISKNENYKMGSFHEGVELLKRRAFYGRKVLIVLDDVDRVEQMDALAIDPRVLCRGSRIIVTTRNISSLYSLQSVLSMYELELLNKDESLQLFSLHAFNQHNPPEGFMELSNTVVDYARGIPLVLEIWGCFLNGNNDQSEWRSAIAKMKKIPHDDVQGKLRISFDSLDEKEEKLFLEIACFFFRESKNFTIQVLQDYEIFPEIGFRRLENLCLLKCVGPLIVMHDILKQMGREIVRQENVDYPGKRSRLWDYKDALNVLKNCEGTEAVEGLILLHNGKDIKVKAKAFQKMTRLRVLHLDHVRLSTGYKHLSRNLVWLRWHHFGLRVLPLQLYLENLVALDLSYSNIKRLWMGPKVLSKLKFLDLSYCYNLTTTPNFHGLPNIEELYLRSCMRLQEVDKSIGHLDKLRVLNLKHCRRLKKFTTNFSRLPNLEELFLSFCVSLQEVDKSIGHLDKLRVLDLEDCWRLKKLTPNFSGLPNLEELVLRNCVRLQQVDKCIGHLDKLRYLNVNGCESLPKLLSEMGIKQDWRVTKVLCKLKFLEFRCCHNLTTTPNFSWIPNIEILFLTNCIRLQEVDKSIGHLHKLRVLHVNCCKSLRKLPSEMANLKSLEQVAIYGSPNELQILAKKSTGSLGLSLNFLQGLRCLKSLRIEHCSMTQLPDEIGSLISLTHLNILRSKFSCLPKSICNLTKLQRLRIEYCDMSNLPSEFGRLNRLEVLNLQGNKFCSLPESISDLTNLQKLDLSYCERLQSLPKLSGGPCLIIAVNSYPSLRRISLESITNSRIMSCYMCPKLDMNHFAHEIGTSFFSYKVVGSFTIHYLEGMFPDWLQHETTNSYYALKVPPLGVGNKHFIRCIFYVVYRVEVRGRSWSMGYKLRNKTKDVFIDIAIASKVYVPLATTDIRDPIIFEYRSFHVDKLDLEEGDEIEISWNYENVVLKKWGIHVSFDTTDDHH